MAAPYHHDYDYDYEHDSRYPDGGRRGVGVGVGYYDHHNQYSPPYSDRARHYEDPAPLPPQFPPGPAKAAPRIPFSLTPGQGTQNLSNLPPLPASPRWDSFSSHASHQYPSSPSSARFPSYSHDYPPEPHYPRQGPPPPVSYDGSNVMHERINSPLRPLATRPSLTDMRSHDAGPMENFSRPRTKSMRQATPDYPKQYPRVPNFSPADSYHDSLPSPTHTAPWQRPRGPSVSSWQSSSSNLAPAYPLAHGDVPDPRYPRARNVTGPPHLPTGRPPFANRVDSSASAPAFTGGAPPWLSGDELRSSFRSQHSASSGPVTAITERSSVLTKDTSIGSVYAHPDEPSLEDVMGMYENGFNDDEHDHSRNPSMNHSRNPSANHSRSLSRNPSVNYSRPHSRAPSVNYDHSINGNRINTHNGTIDGGDNVIGEAASNSRPLTPVSDVSELRRPFGMFSSRDDDLDERARPVTSGLDAEIRQSKMIFTSFEFISSVPHIVEKQKQMQGEEDDDEEDEKTPEKRDSGKSLDSDPSLKAGPIVDGALSEQRMANSPSPPAPSASPSPVPQPTVEEDPGCRDRYGFKKENQHITRKQYDAWNKGYSEYLDRRRKKWVSYLKDSSLMTDHPTRFPAPSPKTKRFVRKGIPPEWRGSAWFYYAGGPAILAKHGGLYGKLLDRSASKVDSDAIERDLHRTFPDNIKFKPPGSLAPEPASSERQSQSTMGGSDSGSFELRIPESEPPIISALRRVLHAFAIYNPRIGYCQSLNFLAGMLLLFVETEEQCFWLLNVITSIYLPGTHETSLEGSKIDLGVLMTELRDSMPAVWDKIGGELEAEPTGRPQTSKSLRKPRTKTKRGKSDQGLSTERLPPITLCMTAWFMSCFIGTLPIETTLRVWDVFFYEGSKTLFRVALSIFKMGEAEIKAVKDPMEMFGVVQAMPRRMLDANEVMEVCFKRRNGFGHLNQGVIDQRRQERRDLVRRDAEEQKLGRSATTINTEESSGRVHRRGTLFGRKKRDDSKTRMPEV